MLAQLTLNTEKKLYTVHNVHIYCAQITIISAVLIIEHSIQRAHLLCTNYFFKSADLIIVHSMQRAHLLCTNHFLKSAVLIALTQFILLCTVDAVHFYCARYTTCTFIVHKIFL